MRAHEQPCRHTHTMSARACLHMCLACPSRALWLAAPPGPVELVVAIARDVKATKQNKTRRAMGGAAIMNKVVCLIATYG